nr:hypothetical protein [uncultured Carboxylicivirga sp.]
MAIGLSMLAAPAIAAEVSLIGGTTWSSIPLVQGYIMEAASATLGARGIGVLFDATSQFVPAYINSDFNFSSSINKINVWSLGMTFLSPEAKTSSVLLNGFISSSLRLNINGNFSTGSFSDILIGTIASASFDKAGGKIGDGFMQKSFIKSNVKWGHYFDAMSSLNPLFQYGKEGGGKYYQMQMNRLFKEALLSDFIDNGINYLGISLGTQITKNETINLTDYINELNFEDNE